MMYAPIPRAMTMANPAAARIVGYDSVDELLKCTPRDLCDDPELRRRMMQELVETGQVVDFECRLRNKDGSPVWASMTAKVVRDAQDRPVYIDYLSLDVTKRKRAEAALQAAHAKLVNTREKERRRLAGDLHDSIGQRLVALQLVLESAAHDPAVRRDSARAQRLAEGSQSCRDLIREIRDLCHGLYPPTLESRGVL